MNQLPELEFKGFHHDIARGAYLHPERVHDLIRQCAVQGYTQVMLYLENMLRLPSIARACPPCAYSTEDWRAFEATARRVNVELVPWFNTIGHTKDICDAYPQLGGLEDRGIMQLDPTRAVTRDWTQHCLDEFCAISSSRWFVIGGDEWQPPVHLLQQPGFDTGVAWTEQINHAAEHLRSRGKIPVVAHDMLWNSPHVHRRLSRDIAVLFWYYLPDSDYAAVRMLRDWGFRQVMMCTCASFGSPMSSRAVQGMNCALEVVRKNQLRAMTVATWEDCRWEQTRMHVVLSGRLLRGQPIPQAILAVTDAYESWERLPGTHPQARAWEQHMRRDLDEAAWDAFDECRQFIIARLDQRPERELELYLRHHAPYGPIHERLLARCDEPHAVTKTIVSSVSEPASNPPSSSRPALWLQVDSHPVVGDVLRFFNGSESFVIYPALGASLQDWRVGQRVVIPSSIERFLSKRRHRGGFRGFQAAGGLRVIWALGTHNLPCCVWSASFKHHVIEQSSERLIIDLIAGLPHVDLQLRVTVVRGVGGFVIQATGINQLEHAWASFHWNLPVAVDAEQVSQVQFTWEQDQRMHERSLASQPAANFIVPAPGPITVRLPEGALQIGADPQRTWGYVIDWGPTFLTPDVLERYVPLRVGERYQSCWQMHWA